MGGFQVKPLTVKFDTHPTEKDHPDGQARRVRKVLATPFVRVDLKRGKFRRYRKALGEIDYGAMIDLIKFQVIAEHDSMVSARTIRRRYCCRRSCAPIAMQQTDAVCLEKG